MVESCCECCTKTVTRRTGIGLFLLAITLITLGMWLPPALRHKIDQTITDRVTLTQSGMDQNTDAYRVWQDSSQDDAVPYWYKVWVNNCTNPGAVLQGAQPILAEIGPFVYRLYTKRLNVSFDADEYGRDRVFFQKWEYYVYQPDQSGPGLVDDNAVEIVSLRMPFQSLINTPYAAHQYGNNSVWTDYDRLFARHTVRDFLFGYNDREIANVHKMGVPGTPASWPGVVGNTSDYLDAIQLPLHAQYTGLTPNEEILRSYLEFNGMQYFVYLTVPVLINETYQIVPLPVWGSKAANRIVGSDGLQFPRYLTPGQSLEAWVDDLKRPVTLINTDNATYTYEGIELYRFVVAPHFFQNETEYPPNSVYWQSGCSGFLNNTFVEPGFTSILMSQPHFLGVPSECDQVWKGVTGLPAPDPENDRTVIDVEPFSGIPMHAWKRLQINVHVHPVSVTYNGGTENFFPKVRDMFWPIFRIEEGGVIPDNLASDFVKDVYGLQKLADVMTWLGFIGGSVLVATSLIIVFYSHTMSELATGGGDYSQPLAAPTGDH